MSIKTAEGQRALQYSCTDLLKFLLQEFFPLGHQLDAVGKGGENPSRGRLKRYRLPTEIDVTDINGRAGTVGASDRKVRREGPGVKEAVRPVCSRDVLPEGERVTTRASVALRLEPVG